MCSQQQSSSTAAMATALDAAAEATALDSHLHSACSAEAQRARQQLDYGVYTCKRLHALVRQMSELSATFSGGLQRLVREATAPPRQRKLERDTADGVVAMWHACVDLAQQCAATQHATAEALVERVCEPLAALQAHLEQQRKCVDLLRNDRHMSVDATSAALDRSCRRACKAFASLQEEAARTAADAASSAAHTAHTGVFKRLAQKRAQRSVTAKMGEVRRLFQQHVDEVDRANAHLDDLHRHILRPVQVKIDNLEANRREVLSDCAKQLHQLFSVQLVPNSSLELLEQSSREIDSSIQRRPESFSKEHIRFEYGLPCSPDSFLHHSWPGCPEALRSVCVGERSERESDADEREARPGSCRRESDADDRTENPTWPIRSVPPNDTNADKGENGEHRPSVASPLHSPTSSQRTSSEGLSFVRAKNLIEGMLIGQIAAGRTSSSSSSSLYSTRRSSSVVLQHPTLQRVTVNEGFSPGPGPLEKSSVRTKAGSKAKTRQRRRPTPSLFTGDTA